MRTLWSGPEVEFHGEYVNFDTVTCSPRPVGGDIPIIVGGDTELALNRAARLADGYFPGSSDTEKLSSLITSLREKSAERGRDPDGMEVSAIFGSLHQLPSTRC